MTIVRTDARHPILKHAVHDQKDHGNRYGRSSRVNPKPGDEVVLSSKARAKFGFTGPLRAVVQFTQDPDQSRARQGYSVQDVQVRLIEQGESFWMDSRYIKEGPISEGHWSRFEKHGDGSHDDENHGNWADGIRTEADLPRGAHLLQPGKGERTGGLEHETGEKWDSYLVDDQGNEIPYSHEAIVAAYGKEGARYLAKAQSVADLYGVEIDQIGPRHEAVFNSAIERYTYMDSATGVTAQFGTPSKPGEAFWVRELIAEKGRLVDHPWPGGKMPAWAKEYIAHIDGLGEATETSITWGEGAGTHLWELDRFYQRWNKAFNETSGLTSIPMDRIAASASAISPSLKGSTNLLYATDMAHMVSDNPVLPEVVVTRAISAMETRAAKHWRDKAALEKEFNKDGSPKKYRADWVQEAIDLEETVALLQAGERQFNNLPGIGMAYTGHHLRQSYTAPEGKDLGPGFSVTAGYGNYAKAFNVLRGHELTNGTVAPLTPNDVLGEVKTRSFANNAMDPNNEWGFDDVTVDFHDLNMGGFMIGSDDVTALSGTPKIRGVGLGLRAIHADAIRELAGRSFDYDGTPMHGSGIQQITWSEWQRGTNNVDQLSTSSDPLTWTAFDGTVNDLHLIDSSKKFSGVVIPKGEKP